MKKSRTSKKLGTDFERLDGMRDEDIDSSEIPELTSEMFRHMVVRGNMLNEPKDELTLRIDRDVLQWFQSRGAGYENLINFLMRSYMQEQLRKPRPRARRA
jgi:uncharacterized protein (DUF4415 family)